MKKSIGVTLLISTSLLIGMGLSTTSNVTKLSSQKSILKSGLTAGDDTPDFSDDFEQYKPKSEGGDFTDLSVNWTNAWFRKDGTFDDAACNNEKFSIEIDPTNPENKCLYLDTYTTFESFSYLTVKDLMVKDFELTYDFLYIGHESDNTWTGISSRKPIDGRYNGVDNVLTTVHWNGSGDSCKYDAYRSVGTSFTDLDDEGAPSYTMTKNTWYQFKLTAITSKMLNNSGKEVNGTTFTWYINNEKQFETKLTQASANVYGMVSINSCVNKGYYDNFSLTNLDTEPYVPEEGGEEVDNTPVINESLIEGEIGKEIVIEGDFKGQQVTDIKYGDKTLLSKYYSVDGNKITISVDGVNAIGAGTKSVTVITTGGEAIVTIKIVDNTPDPEPEPEPTPEKKGCGGSIIATSAIISTLALAGGLIAIVNKKRKK